MLNQHALKLHVSATEYTTRQFYAWREGNSPVWRTALWYRNIFILLLTETSGFLMTKLGFALLVLVYRTRNHSWHGKTDLIRVSTWVHPTHRRGAPTQQHWYNYITTQVRKQKPSSHSPSPLFKVVNLYMFSKQLVNVRIQSSIWPLNLQVRQAGSNFTSGQGTTTNSAACKFFSLNTSYTTSHVYIFASYME